MGRHRRRIQAGQPGQPRVREAGALEFGEGVPLAGQPVGAHRLLHRHDIGDLPQEPAVHGRGPMDGIDGDPEAHGLGDAQEVVG